MGRVAGNVVSEDQLASLEYATKYAGAKLIVVMGHEGCGAVKGACAHLEDSHLTSLLAKIKPAISAAQEKGISSEAPEFVNVVIEQNIYEQVKQLREQSPILASLEKEGKISIVGAYYAISTGEVTFMNEDQ